MNTGNLEYTRNIYKRIKVNEKSWNYSLKKRLGNLDSFYTEEVKIEENKFRHRPNSTKFKHWVVFKDGTSFTKSNYKSGMVKVKYVNYDGIYQGNIPDVIDLNNKDLNNGKDWYNPKHLFLIQFSKDYKTMVIDVFNHFYPNNINLLKTIINEHEFKYIQLKDSI